MDGGDPFTIIVTGQFEFQQRVAIGCRLTGMAFHHGRAAKRNGQGRDCWYRFGQASQSPQGDILSPAFQIPQRAVEGVTRCSARHLLEQLRMIEVRMLGSKLLYFIRTIFCTLAFIIDRCRFRPSGNQTVRYRAQDNIDMGFRAPADDEGASDRPSFDGDRYNERHAPLLPRTAKSAIQFVKGRCDCDKVFGCAAPVTFLAIGSCRASADRRAI